MSSHGLKKPLMLANKDAIPNTDTHVCFELGIISQGHPSISHPAMVTCDQAQQITSLLPQNGIPLAESFPVQTNIH